MKIIVRRALRFAVEARDKHRRLVSEGRTAEAAAALSQAVLYEQMVWRRGVPGCQLLARRSVAA